MTTVREHRDELLDQCATDADKAATTAHAQIAGLGPFLDEVHRVRSFAAWVTRATDEQRTLRGLPARMGTSLGVVVNATAYTNEEFLDHLRVAVDDAVSLVR
jgi:hypothetical protein